MKFTEWFENRLVVGAYPYMNSIYFNSKEFDIAINVSDEFYSNYDNQITEHGCKSFWFPMNEVKKDIGLNSIYGAMVILFNAEREGKRVYLHCHAGVHRSQLVKCCYYFLRTGKQLDNNWGSFVNQLLADCARGYLPPKSEMEDFLNNIGKRIESFKGNPMGGTLDACKIDTLRNF